MNVAFLQRTTSLPQPAQETAMPAIGNPFPDATVGRTTTTATTLAQL